jgi:hypothetical protein
MSKKTFLTVSWGLLLVLWFTGLGYVFGGITWAFVVFWPALMIWLGELHKRSNRN